MCSTSGWPLERLASLPSEKGAFTQARSRPGMIRRRSQATSRQKYRNEARAFSDASSISGSSPSAKNTLDMVNTPKEWVGDILAVNRARFKHVVRVAFH